MNEILRSVITHREITGGKRYRTRELNHHEPQQIPPVLNWADAHHSPDPFRCFGRGASTATASRLDHEPRA